MASDRLPRPSVNVEFTNFLDNPEFASITLRNGEGVGAFRAACADWFRMLRDAIHGDPELAVEEQAILGPHGDIPIVILRRQESKQEKQSRRKPALPWLNGGARITGDAYTTLANVVPVAKDLGGVVASVDYRLVPESPGMTAIDDCYAALAWLFTNAEELSVDAERIILGGEPAGGGMAACTCILARDRDTAKPLALLL